MSTAPVTPRPLKQASQHPAVAAVMSAAATLLGMEVVFLGGLSPDRFTFEKIHPAGTWPGLHEGLSRDLADTLCHRMLNGATACTADASHDPYYSDSPVLAELAIRSYVGVPVRDISGQVVATLCGIDRGSVTVSADAVKVLAELAEVISAHLGLASVEGIVIRRTPQGGWAVGEDTSCAPNDLTSAMALADLLAEDVEAARRPSRTDQPLDEIEQLRLSVKQLEHALAARVVVEQAIGVLTERQHGTPREAFEKLRKVARSRGRKVHDLAREVVASASQPAVPLPPELAGPR